MKLWRFELLAGNFLKKQGLKNWIQHVIQTQSNVRCLALQSREPQATQMTSDMTRLMVAGVLFFVTCGMGFSIRRHSHLR